MASSAGDLVKNGTVVPSEEKGTTEMLDPEMAAEQEEEEVDAEGDEPQAAAPPAEGKKMWRVPPHQVDFILSWDVAADVVPNLDRIDRLPFSEEEKEASRAAELEGVAARNKLRRIMRDTQQWVRELLEKHGEVVVDEKHTLDAYLARSKSKSSG
ncbi:hypothetical protein SETIT_8G128300v2 [Setaria italica]|uniref:Uncharacterized protein n=2 Tax=Setaria TaxID=4554 RepID=A0A368S7E6_SETIT|nr:hypothetical protein SETIT_8G128300v2 [Setaria italica]TKW00792.1 hypothetical protein SEVIR_8G135300v2 [Setaria viridis]